MPNPTMTRAQKQLAAAKRILYKLQDQRRSLASAMVATEFKCEAVDQGLGYAIDGLEKELAQWQRTVEDERKAHGQDHSAG